VVVVDGPGPLRAVLTDVYAALGLDWDPETTGAVSGEAPSAGLEDVRAALLAEYRTRYTLLPAPLTEVDLARARELLERHRLDQRT
jgi:hypothetical protein